MTDFEILLQLCETADELSKKYISSSSPDFKAWKTRTDRLLIRRFGKDSYEFKSFSRISYSLSFFTSGTPDSAFVEACADGLRSAKAVLETYLDEFSDKGKPDRLQMSEIIQRYLSFMATTESLEKGSRESSKGRA